jgi:hypothetical protein
MGNEAKLYKENEKKKKLQRYPQGHNNTSPISWQFKTDGVWCSHVNVAQANEWHTLSLVVSKLMRTSMPTTASTNAPW